MRTREARSVLHFATGRVADRSDADTRQTGRRSRCDGQRERRQHEIIDVRHGLAVSEQLERLQVGGLATPAQTIGYTQNS